MTDVKDRVQRRVYVLPTELVERIVAFQHEAGLASEVEAVRRLLDDSLKHRDDFITITSKFIDKLLETKSHREAAKEVLADHPLVVSINFSDDYTKFILSNSIQIVVDRYNKATIWDENDNILDLGSDHIPNWVSSKHSRIKLSTNKTYELDEDIPF